MMDRIRLKEAAFPYEVASTLWRYEPDTGLIYWRQPRCVGHDTTRPASHVHRKRCGKAYRSVITRQDGKQYELPAHRLAWLLYHGTWPQALIDHINGIGTDNRIVNLREATSAENARNRASIIRSKSGTKGVHWSEPNQSWRAIIRVSGLRVHLGYFETRAEAEAAYAGAARLAFKQFARVTPPAALGPYPLPVGREVIRPPMMR